LLDKNTDAFIRSISFAYFEMIALCMVCGVVVFLKGRQESIKKTIFWLAVCVVAVALMSGPSFRLWQACTWLLAAIQYPWRFNVVLCLGCAAVVTLFLKEVTLFPRRVQVASIALILLMVLPWVFSYAGVWKLYREDKAPPKPIVDDDDGWFPAWSAPGIDEARALQASLGSRITFLAQGGTASLLVWKPRRIEFEATSLSVGKVIVSQFYFPLWRATLMNPSDAIEPKPAMPEGLLELDLPPGTHHVTLYIPYGKSEQIGKWISIICALFCIVFFRTRWSRNSQV
jgi:hypothetical protein